MFVTEYKLNPQKVYPFYTFKRSNNIVETVYNKLVHGDSIPKVTTVSADKVKLNAFSSIFAWFEDKEYTAIKDDENGYPYYRCDKYLLRLFEKKNYPDYNIKTRAEYVETTNSMENSVFCYTLRELEDYYVEIYDNHKTFYEFEDELSKQKEDAYDSKTFSKLLIPHIIYYYYKIVTFINELNKRGLSAYIYIPCLFFDDKRDIKILPMATIRLNESNQYSALTTLCRWITGIKYNESNKMKLYKDFDYGDVLREISNLLENKELEYKTVMDMIKMYAGTYMTDPRLSTGSLRYEFNKLPVIQKDGKWVPNPDF